MDASSYQGLLAGRHSRARRMGSGAFAPTPPETAIAEARVVVGRIPQT